MDIKLFDYHLPKELIAQYPPRRRGDSRLMVLYRESGETMIRPFGALTNYLKKGDALVINNTRVFKARLIGRRKTGAEVEIFLTRALSYHTTGGRNRLSRWEGLAQPSRRLREGEEIHFDVRHWITLDNNLGEGRWLVSFPSKEVERKIIGLFGHTPLPQYIRRDDEDSDEARYQTVFARKDRAAAVAAPTAGLHFTKHLLEKIKRRGVKIVEVTLDVGPGTFKPVKVQDIKKHTVDPEQATLTAKAATALNRVRTMGGRIFAVGSTSLRTLESAAIVNGEIQPFSGEVNLYIKLSYKFRVTDALLTNFHLPKSSLLILVSALVGREKVLEVYQEAIRNRMRFYSYGDAMLIL